MIELQDSFQGKGEVSDYSFIKVVSNNTAYVYEISDLNNNRHYETFKRKEQQECNTLIAGNAVHYDAKVKYPTSNDFGVWAWCFKSLESAMSKFKQITDENPTKPHIPNNPEHFKEIHEREAYQSNMN